MRPWYNGVLGNISYQTKSKDIDDALNVHVVHRQSLSEESIIVFRPSFLKKQYVWHSIDRGGHISKSLSTDCVVSFKAPVFDMCRSGDIRGLQDAFSNGSVSIDVVNQYGMGLLHVGAVLRPLSSPSHTL